MAGNRLWRLNIDIMIILISAASLVLSSVGFIHPFGVVGRHHAQASSARPKTHLAMDINSDDPFQILGLSEATTDKKIIKRAYKRMALKYHPDVLSTTSPEEKKEANDRFAKINWAYSQLSGKGEDNKTYNTKSTTQKTTATGSWTPPHRRSSVSQRGSQSYTSGSDYSKRNVDWSDFMPESDDSYNTNGDSFGKIFSDMFAGVASGAVSGAAGSTIFKDFIEFLEGNVDGFGATDDSELLYLLERGTKQEIRNELDDTKLVVDQLIRKQRDIENEIYSATTELSETENFLEKIRLEETVAELNARKNVAKGYLQKAEKRLLRLQMRYKELKTNNPQWEDIKQESASSSYSSTKDNSWASQEAPSRGPDGSWKNEEFDSPSPGVQQPTALKDEKEQSWKAEGFGSSARRGSRRRRSAESKTKKPEEPTNFKSSENMQSNVGSEQSWRAQGSGSSRSGPQDWGTESQRSSATGTKPGRTVRDASLSGTSSGVQNPSTEPIPPHRRRAPSRNTQNNSKRRLREIIVDEEFEKLKRELGL